MGKDFWVESAAITHSSVAMKGGAGIGFLSILGQMNWLGIISILIAAAGFWVNRHYLKKKHDREAEENKLKLEHMINADRRAQEAHEASMRKSKNETIC